MEVEAREWIEKVLGHSLGEGELQQELKDGTVLCNLVRTLQPSCGCQPPSTSAKPFPQRCARSPFN